MDFDCDGFCIEGSDDEVSDLDRYEGRIHSNNLSLKTFNYSDIDEDDGTIVDSNAPIGDATTADEIEPGDLYKAQYNNIKYAPSSFLCDK